MAIHQIVVAASAGDAVTNAALSFRSLLRKVGGSELYARYIDPRLEGDVRPLSSCGRGGDRNDLLVYHVSIGEPDVAAFLLGRSERLVIVYHNITPPEYFAAFDPAFAGLLGRGRYELELLRDRVELALGVSEFNARELESVGYRRVGISPLPIDFSEFHSVDPDAATMSELEDLDGPHILFVGQLLPHKRPDLLLQAYQVLTSYTLPEVHLTLLGPGRLAQYHEALATLARELNLHRVRIPGWVTQEELAAHYRGADVFVTMSEHEGVCVPLLEAMSSDLPVVARAYGAIPETMGGAGLLLPPIEDPFLIAEALGEVIANESLRADLIKRGRDRVRGVRAEDAYASFLGHLAAVA